MSVTDNTLLAEVNRLLKEHDITLLAETHLALRTDPAYLRVVAHRLRVLDAEDRRN